jgi:hypothetical protein
MAGLEFQVGEDTEAALHLRGFPTFPFHRATLPQQFGGEFDRIFRQIRAAFHMRSTTVPGESVEKR